MRISFSLLLKLLLLLFTGELINKCDYDTNTRCNLNKNSSVIWLRAYTEFHFNREFYFAALGFQMAIEIWRIFISMPLMTALDVSICSRLHVFLIDFDDKKIAESIKHVYREEWNWSVCGQGDFKTNLNMHVIILKSF